MIFEATRSRMTFERTFDPRLVASLMVRAWDRPEMLCEGASLDRLPSISDCAQYFVGSNDGKDVALFVGYQQSPVCIDLHVCLAPECRGRKAIEASREFLAWLPKMTPFRKAIGSVPAYNKPMLIVALAAGMNVLGINRQSTMRNGKLEDQIIVERRLA